MPKISTTLFASIAAVGCLAYNLTCFQAVWQIAQWTPSPGAGMIGESPDHRDGQRPLGPHALAHGEVAAVEVEEASAGTGGCGPVMPHDANGAQGRWVCDGHSCRFVEGSEVSAPIAEALLADDEQHERPSEVMVEERLRGAGADAPSAEATRVIDVARSPIADQAVKTLGDAASINRPEVEWQSQQWQRRVAGSATPELQSPDVAETTDAARAQAGHVQAGDEWTNEGAVDGADDGNESLMRQLRNWRPDAEEAQRRDASEGWLDERVSSRAGIASEPGQPGGLVRRLPPVEAIGGTTMPGPSGLGATELRPIYPTTGVD